jgi:hypothetical protein
MPAHRVTHSSRTAFWLALNLLAGSSFLAIAALADSSTKIHQSAASGCYCHCTMAKMSVGCEKICDLPKFAMRRWAVTCAKPHASIPVESPNAQPHLPHVPRAERASN